MMVQRDGFLFAQSRVALDIAMVRSLGAGLLGGEGFILQKFTGPGSVFVHAGGDHVDFTLGPGETLQVQTGHLVAFEPSVDYDVQLVGSIRTAIFGGEGLFLAYAHRSRASHPAEHDARAASPRAITLRP